MLVSAKEMLKKAKEGKSIMIYGVIAIFVMSSIWGLVKFIGDELTIPSTSNGTIHLI